MDGAVDFFSTSTVTVLDAVTMGFTSTGCVDTGVDPAAVVDITLVVDIEFVAATVVTVFEESIVLKSFTRLGCGTVDEVVATTRTMCGGVAEETDVCGC